MKAICLEAIEKLNITQTEKPTLTGPGQVIIEVKHVGICGSELHAFKGTHPYRKPPAILGHEMLGYVTEVSEDVTRVTVGDRVTVDPQWVCEECEWCKKGDHNLCVNKRVLGTVEWPGALGEYILCPDYSVYPIPDHLTDDQATMIEPLAVGVHAVKRARLQKGESVLILGTGSIGNVTTAMAHVYGADPIIVADVQQHCLDTAPRLGATHSILVGHEDIATRVNEITGGKGADVVFITHGTSELFDAAFEAVRKQGRIVVVALFKKPVPINPYNIIKKDIDIVGTIMSTDEDVQEAIEVVASGKVDPAHIVTHHLPIDEAQHGFELAATKNDGAIKVVLDF